MQASLRPRSPSQPDLAMTVLKCVHPKRLTLILLIGIFAATGHGFVGTARGQGKQIKLAVGILTGIGASQAMANSVEAAAVQKEQDSIVRRLDAKGIEPENAAIYSVYLKVDPKATAIKWARIFSMPDLFIVVQIQGQGTFLLPNIQQDYRGQAVQENLIAKLVKPGERVLVHILDDRKFRNDVWNSILQTKIHFAAAAGVAAEPGLRLNVGADGSFQILNRNTTISPPGYLATAEFNVPTTGDDLWVAEAFFYDEKENPVGKLQLAQMWKSNPREVQRLHAEKEAAILNAKKAVDDARKKKVFMYGVAVVLGLVSLKLIFFK